MSKLGFVPFLFALAVSACTPRGERAQLGVKTAAEETTPPSAPSPCANPTGPAIEIPIIPAGSRLSGVPGNPNFQRVTGQATVPEGSWCHIGIRYRVKPTCSGTVTAPHRWPADCDPFDRVAHLALADAGQIPIMMVDGMTAFGGETLWEEDVTDYLPVLAGTHTFSAFITSGASADGVASGVNAGFDVEASLVLTPGKAPRDVKAVVPIFFNARYGRQSDGSGVPADPIDATAAPPAEATHARIDFFTTGHGGVGAHVCDEFCQKANLLNVDGRALVATAPWTYCHDNCTRDPLPEGQLVRCGGMEFNYRCRENPTGCPFSVTLNRAGWCPGRKVSRQSFHLPVQANAGPQSIGYQVEGMEGFWQVAAAAIYYGELHVIE
jgi:hypothetical protein